MSARRELEEARSRPDDQRAVSADQLIASAAAGHPPVAAAPPGPSERDKQIAVLENVYQQWKLAAAASEKAIPVRRREAEAAAEKVQAAAMRVAAAEVDVEALLQRAEHLTKTLVADRLTLRFVRTSLSAEQRSRVERFLRDATLPGDPSYGEPSSPDWDRHPIAAAMRSAVAALTKDADAPLPDGGDG